MFKYAITRSAIVNFITNLDVARISNLALKACRKEVAFRRHIDKLRKIASTWPSRELLLIKRAIPCRFVDID